MDFIISAPRSGSTWLANILSHLPEVFVSENRFFGNYFDTWQDSKQHMHFRVTADYFIRSFTNHYLQFSDADKKTSQDLILTKFLSLIQETSAEISGNKLYFDKVTPYKDTCIRTLRNIRKFFPEARIIQLVRDGRDVVTSGVFDWIWREQPILQRHEFFIRKKEHFIMDHFFDEKSIIQWAEHWTEINTAISKIFKSVHLVTYEKMILDPVTEIIKIAEFLDYNWPMEHIQSAVKKNSFYSITGRMRGTEDIYSKNRKGIVGDWRNYFTKEDAILFQKIAGQTMIRFGYIERYDWINILPTTLNRSRNI